MISAYPALIEAREALDEGKHQLAAKLVIAHLRSNQAEPRGLALLGSIALATGAFRQAEGFLREAIARGADDLDVKRELARCINQQDRLEEGLALFEAIHEQDPKDRQTLATIAWIYDKFSRHDRAREIYQQLVDTHPGEAAYWVGLGLSYRAEGRTADAVEAFRRGVSAGPGMGQPWWELASIKGDVLTDEDVKALEGAIAGTTNVNDLALQHFALGRAMQQRSAHEAAFDHYREANRLLDEDIGYDPRQLTAEIDEVSGMFDADYFARLPQGGDPSEAPIFVVSLPRAGSTLVEQMLGSHSDVEPLGELTYAPSLIRLMMERATIQQSATVPQAIARMSPDERTELGAEYVRRASAHRRTDASRFTDKMPHNWTNILFLRHILPNAKFVEVRRKPIASGFANFTHWFTRVHSSSFSLEHIGRTYRDYVRLMAHIDQAVPGLVHHVRYEELIDGPEALLRSTLDHLGLPWDASVLRHYDSERIIRTPSAEQVRRPINREGIGAWKPYRQWLGPLIEELGTLADDELAEADQP
jgi:tetratricopeptide (TPR) repeat protein